ncbi:MAG: LysR family transcriptional regulator [Rhodospirillales bacterium]|nr:LysR family transcriptional regulator [Rhodospirillales bacterium]
MSQSQHQSILFEMLRSFTTLAYTLNLSKAVRILGSTRQTLRRHIDILEEIRGEKLFEVQDRQYHLTETGSQSLKEAGSLLERGEAWLEGRIKTVDGLSLVKYDDEDGFSLYSQQYPVTRIWEDSPPLLRHGLKAWVDAKAQLEHPAMDKIAPYTNVYRKHKNSWLCVRVGEQSSIARWLGPVWAKSAIGCVLEEDPMSCGADLFTIENYDRVSQETSIRLDHVFVRLPRKEGEKPQSARYQRLLFRCFFPDGNSAVATLIAITNKVDIAGLDLTGIPLTPEDALMEFDL